MLAERVLDGESCAAAVLTSVSQQVQAMKIRSGITPGLAVILVSASLVRKNDALTGCVLRFLICAHQGAIHVDFACILLQIAKTVYFFEIGW